MRTHVLESERNAYSEALHWRHQAEQHARNLVRMHDAALHLRDQRSVEGATFLALCLDTPQASISWVTL